MRRSDLEHLLRAAGEITGERELIVIGSQAILGAHPAAPAELLRSMEADLYPRHRPELADAIDGAIGEASLFHETHGYYAQGVGPTTATLPQGWENRLIVVEGPNTRGVRGLCLEPHDLAIAKYVAGRDKDLAYTRALARHAITSAAVLRERLARTKLDPRVRDVVAARIARDLGVKPGRPRRRR